jgi:phosphoadenosine phosphosulfate reductase
MNNIKTAPFLGSFDFFWCDHCNLPLLEDSSCQICEGEPRKVPITPPGDIRPAFPEYQNKIATVIDKAFGSGSAEVLGLTGDRLVLVNEVGYDDLMEEVIIDGRIVGSIRYQLPRETWDFYPRMEGAERIFDGFNGSNRKRFVQVDEGAVPYIKKGFNVLAPGVINYDPSLVKGQAVVALGPENEVLSSGLMSVDAKDIKQMEKGMVLKSKHCLKDHQKEDKPNLQVTDQTWTQAVKANASIIEQYELEALTNISKMIEKHSSLSLSVSFSGGKDSLVCLQLARKLPKKQDYKILFVNTSLEFPQTITYVENVLKKLDLDDRLCRVDVPPERFWKNVKKFGPPGKDFRYCCKLLKIGPINQLIDDCIGKKTLCLVGQRAYESISRANSDVVWTNPWIPNQLNYTPIQNWTALHVWLYLFKERIPYNPIYDLGFSRIGCWLCPACTEGVYDLILEHKLIDYKKWAQFLENWRKKRNLPKEWLTWGLWRWRKQPAKMMNLAKRYDEDIKKNQTPLKRGNWSIDYNFSESVKKRSNGSRDLRGLIQGNLSLERIATFLNLIGKVEQKKNSTGNLNSIVLRLDDETTFSLTENGKFSIIAKGYSKLKTKIGEILHTIYRTIECTACGLCVDYCPVEALRINNENKKVELSLDKCTKCGICQQLCPIVKFGPPDIDLTFPE